MAACTLGPRPDFRGRLETESWGLWSRAAPREALLPPNPQSRAIPACGDALCCEPMSLGGPQVGQAEGLRCVVITTGSHLRGVPCTHTGFIRRMGKGDQWDGVGAQDCCADLDLLPSPKAPKRHEGEEDRAPGLCPT